MQTQSRAVVPLLILILLALLCLAIARADAAVPTAQDALQALRAAGGKLALSDDAGSVYLMDPDASTPERIGYGNSLTWSPDGQAVVVGTHAWLDLRVGAQMALRDGPCHCCSIRRSGCHSRTDCCYSTRSSPASI